MRLAGETARRMARLDRSRSELDSRGCGSKETNKRQLIPTLIEFESERMRFFDENQGVGSARLQDAFCRVAELDPPLTQVDEASLLELQRILVDQPGGNPPLRTGEADLLCPNHPSIPADLVRRALDRFFEWVGSPSYGELHAVEQMTVAQLRLYEISPFQRCSRLTVDLFVYSFLSAGSYLLPSYRVNELPEFRQLLAAAFDFSTEGLVSFHLRACQRSYDRIFSG